MAINKVWVLAEAFEGKPLSITQELLTKARELASEVSAWAWGDDVASYAGQLGSYGATKVYSLGDLGGALPGVPLAAAMAAQIEAGNGPDAILFGTTYDGRDAAGRLSAKIDRGVLTNVVDLSVEDGSPTAHHTVFGGAQVVKARFSGSGPGQAPNIFVVRPKSFAAEPGGGGTPEVVEVEVPDSGATNGARVLQRHVEERTGPKLDEAAVVVSGGRGLGEASKYEMIEELAELLHAAPGASRATVDAAWVPSSRPAGGAAGVHRGRAAGRRGRAGAPGRAPAATACTPGPMVELGGYARLPPCDRDARTATAQSGISPARLSRELGTRGLALPNLGD